MTRLLKYNIAHVFLCFLLLVSFSTAKASELSEAEFKIILEQNIRENPKLVLDVLRDNSEQVLKIAQSGGKTKYETTPAPKNPPKRILVASATPAFMEAEFKKMLAKTIKENPNIIMDVLRENPVGVLEIARKGGEERKKMSLRSQWEVDAKEPKVFTIENRAMRGSPDAPVLIAAYSDFSCPHCAGASLVIEDFLINNPTKANFIFKHRPLSGHKYSRTASRYFIAAAMQNDLKAWALYKELYAGREELMEKGEAFILPLAAEVGLDMVKLKADVDSAQVIRILDEDMKEAKKFGFDGAPYILLNNLVIAGAPSPSILAFGVDEAIRLK